MPFTPFNLTRFRIGEVSDLGLVEVFDKRTLPQEKAGLMNIRQIVKSALNHSDMCRYKRSYATILFAALCSPARQKRF